MKIVTSEGSAGWSASFSDNSATGYGPTENEAVRSLSDNVSRRCIAEGEEFMAAKGRLNYWSIRRDALVQPVQGAGI